MNRGVAVWGKQVFVGALDGRLIALDAETGNEIWSVNTIDKPKSYTITGAPRVVKGKVLIGNRGAECLDLLYVGTGNRSPWNHAHRSNGEGDNLFLASIVALDPDDGSYVWHYQTTPGETWDHTATQHMILADLELSSTFTIKPASHSSPSSLPKARTRGIPCRSTRRQGALTIPAKPTEGHSPNQARQSTTEHADVGNLSEPELYKIEPFRQAHPTIKMRLYRPTLQY